MPKMHWCTGKVNLAGQNFTIIWFDATNPISWPEAQVLQAIHGEENVFDLKPVAVSEISLTAEKERLAIKYGYKPVEQTFPGRMPRMETLMPAESEDLPLADEYGQIRPHTAINNGNGNGHPVEEPPAPTPIPPQPDQDEEDDDDAAKAPEPTPAAVFKPGRQRPAKGA